MVVGVLALALALPGRADALAGEPDPGFGTGGFTTLNEPSGPNEQVHDLLALPDGRILIAGTTSGSGGFMLARLTPTGSPTRRLDPAGSRCNRIPGR